MPRKIRFQIVLSSSADEQHPASELNHHGPLVNGWQSSRFSVYPQELIVQFENRAHIRRVQLLSHQYLIGKIINKIIIVSFFFNDYFHFV
jgi:centrosomal protein CEP104